MPSLRDRLQRRWYASTPPAALRPLSRVFGWIVAFRRWRLQRTAQRLRVPVIVVGNIAVGGTGKTPVAIWLLEHLREAGWKPGLIARGYGGRAPAYPLRVTPETPVEHCGDEPLLIALRTGMPVTVAPDRVAAGRAMLRSDDVDIIVTDDGLQHYRLARDLEICVVDGRRGLGNGALLPAGPLREPASRLQEIPMVIVNGGFSALDHPGRIDMQLKPAGVVALRDDARSTLSDWRGQRVHAVAGIGHPERFFELLSGQGIELILHPYPDHYAYADGELDFGDDLPVMMTEKDAVKYRPWATGLHHMVPVQAQLSPDAILLVQQSLDVLKTLYR